MEQAGAAVQLARCGLGQPGGGQLPAGQVRELQLRTRFFQHLL